MHMWDNIVTMHVADKQQSWARQNYMTCCDTHVLGISIQNHYRNTCYLGFTSTLRLFADVLYLSNANTPVYL